MKSILFIITGIPRSINRLINQLNYYNSYDNYDIYLNFDDIDNNYNNKKIDYNELISNKRILKLQINKVDAIIDSKPQSAINNLQQWKKIYNTFNFITDKTKYDIIIRLRTDIYLFENIFEYIDRYDNGIHMSNNDNIAFGDYTNMQLYCSYYNNIHLPFFDYIKSIAPITIIDLKYKAILSECNVISITGDSGSGKSTLTNLIEKIFKYDKYLTLETDRYHKWERNDKNWENYTHLNPEANYLEKLENDTFSLKIGDTIYAVDYNHKTGKFTQKEEIQPSNNLIICGLHTLYSEKLRNLSNIKIFIDTDNQLKTFWKLKRDTIERNHTVNHILSQINKRKPDFDLYIEKQKEHADVIINYYSNDIDNYDNLLKDIKITSDIYISKNMYKHIYDNLQILDLFTIIEINNMIKLNAKEYVIDKLVNYLKYKSIDFINIDELDLDNIFIQIIFITIIYN